MAEKALIFNIVKGSFVDGYGVRTTIFLKGCPLRCTWCCNPEGQSFNAELCYTESKCTGCGRCVEKCVKNALSVVNGKLHVDRLKCNACGECVDACNDEALDIFGKYYTVDEIFDIVAADKPFYDASGGGLTIGGGEATWFPGFVLELIQKCHEAGIKVAIDSCGFETTERQMECLEKADLILFDIKGFDDEGHIINTGRSNSVILNTLRHMEEIGKPVIIRIPYIPDYNDDAEMIRKEAEFLGSLKCVERVDIIPKHEFGKIKYEQIGKPYLLNSPDVPQEKQDELLELFKSYGCNAQIGG